MLVCVLLGVFTFNIGFSKVPGHNIYIIAPYDAIKLIINLFVFSIMCFVLLKIFNNIK